MSGSFATKFVAYCVFDKINRNIYSELQILCDIDVYMPALRVEKEKNQCYTIPNL